MSFSPCKISSAQQTGFITWTSSATKSFCNGCNLLIAKSAHRLSKFESSSGQARMLDTLEKASYKEFHLVSPGVTKREPIAALIFSAAAVERFFLFHKPVSFIKV